MITSIILLIFGGILFIIHQLTNKVKVNTSNALFVYGIILCLFMSGVVIGGSLK